MGSIYLVTNNVNGKQYVGQTTLPLATRWRLHVSAAKKPKSYFHFAIRKYGAASFSYQELEQATTQEDLDTLEIQRIEEYKTRQVGYNLAAGGQGFINHQKMRMSKLRIPLSDAHKQSLRESWEHRDIAPVIANLEKAVAASIKANTGKHHTEEHCRKIAQAALGRVFSPESRLKQSNAWTLERKAAEAMKATARNKKMIGSKWIKKGTASKQVSVEQLGSYLEQGWKLGRAL